MVSHTGVTYLVHCENRAAKHLDVVRIAAEAAGVAFDGMHLFAEHRYAAIIDAASQKACDVISMASHGRKGVAALVLGSETQKVLTHSSIPVVVWR